jgi:hypothetical protein
MAISLSGKRAQKSVQAKACKIYNSIGWNHSRGYIRRKSYAATSEGLLTLLGERALPVSKFIQQPNPAKVSSPSRFSKKHF